MNELCGDAWEPPRSGMEVPGAGAAAGGAAPLAGAADVPPLAWPWANALVVATVDANSRQIAKPALAPEGSDALA